MNPESTYFRQLYRRHTPFAIAENDVGFQGAVAFGKTLTAVIPRNGDLIGETYLQVKLTALEINEAGPASLTQANDYAIWVNAVGHVLCQRVTCEIGGAKFDEYVFCGCFFFENSLISRFLFVFNALGCIGFTYICGSASRARLASCWAR